MVTRNKGGFYIISLATMEVPVFATFVKSASKISFKVENSFRKDFPLLMQNCLEAVWPATYQNLSGLKCISYKVRTNFLINHS